MQLSCWVHRHMTPANTEHQRDSHPWVEQRETEMRTSPFNTETQFDKADSKSGYVPVISVSRLLPHSRTHHSDVGRFPFSSFKKKVVGKVGKKHTGVANQGYAMEGGNDWSESNKHLWLTALLLSAVSRNTTGSTERRLSASSFQVIRCWSISVFQSVI